jgi:hypothetical protein
LLITLHQLEQTTAKSHPTTNLLTITQIAKLQIGIIKLRLKIVDLRIFLILIRAIHL